MDLRKHFSRNIKNLQQPFVPIQRMDIKQHRSGSIGVIGHMDRSSGQLPNQPAVHRSKQKLSCLCPLPSIRNPV